MEPVTIRNKIIQLEGRLQTRHLHKISFLSGKKHLSSALNRTDNLSAPEEADYHCSPVWSLPSSDAFGLHS